MSHEYYLSLVVIFAGMIFSTPENYIPILGALGIVYAFNQQEQKKEENK